MPPHHEGAPRPPALSLPGQLPQAQLHEGVVGSSVPTGPSAWTHPHQVAHGDREADGQRGGADAAAPVVRGCEDAGGQLEGEDDLHHEGLAWGYVVVELEPREGQ